MSNALDLVADLVLRESGIRLRAVQHPALRSAIERALPNEDPAAFLRLASSPVDGPRAIATLIDEVTIKETFFFRDRRQLDAIPWQALLENARSAGSTEIRIWCAACATGEEAYTIALLACEAFGTAATACADPGHRHLQRSPRRRAGRPVPRALAPQCRAEPAAAVLPAGGRAARRRRPPPQHRQLRPAQPRHGFDAATRGDGVRPDRLPKRAHLLRRRDDGQGGRRPSERVATGRHADPRIGRCPVRHRPAPRQARLGTVSPASKARHRPASLSASRSGS